MSERTTFVVGALLRRDGRVLLVEEREPADPRSTWMLPGGRVEPPPGATYTMDRT